MSLIEYKIFLKNWKTQIHYVLDSRSLKMKIRQNHT